MIRAMWRLRIRGKLDRQKYARYKAMLFSVGLPIAGAGEDVRPQFVVQHLRVEVEKQMLTAFGVRRLSSNPAGDWFENFSFDGVVTWLVEHWQEIVQVLAALVVFLQVEYEA